MVKLAIVLVLFSVSLRVGSQPLGLRQTQRLDSLFQALSDNKMSMGSISIYQGGQPVYAKTYGIANVKAGNQIFSTEKTLYRMGSISKIFTAYMVMKLVEENKLSLSQTIEKFFPTLKKAESTTIQQLLAHRSQLPIFVRVDDLEKLRRAKNQDELIAVVNKHEANPVVDKAVYNNLNYILLGLIAEKITGRPYNELLAAYLNTVPNARIYGTYQLLDAGKGEANSFHLKDDKWEEDYENTPSPVSDGSGFLLSDARTLNEFMTALFAGRLLRPESVELMLPRQSTFGYGLMKTNFGEHKGYGHSGRIEGFTGAVTYFPESKTSIAFLQNGTVYPLNDILILVGNILFEVPFKMPALKRIAISREQEEKLMGVYVNDSEGYSVLVDRNKDKLRLRVARGNGLLNKAILAVYPLEANRLFNPSQGILFDFSGDAGNSYGVCEMRVNGAKLRLTRKIEK